MPVLTEYRHGMTMGIPPRRNDHARAKRQAVEGWTDSSTRRNTRFLYAVDERKLTGRGLALSLTIRDCPPTADDWASIRRAFFKRIERIGLVRAHWLTEWQRRGVPHMHAALWITPEALAADPFIIATVTRHWCEAATAYGASPRGQHVAAIDDAIGWFQYLSKHAVRGLSHYQRSPDGIPTGWQKTGRMWGHLGEWPLIEPVRYTVRNDAFWAFRRMVQRWRFADARASADPRRIRAARRMLQSSDRSAASVRGVAEWIGTDQTQQFLRHLAAMGYQIEC